MTLSSYLHHQRDASGRITSTKADQVLISSAVTYYPFGPMQNLTFGNNILTQQRTYDQNQRKGVTEERCQALTIDKTIWK